MKPSTLPSLIVVGALALALFPSAPAAEPRPPSEARVHDPSTIVKCGDRYWFFSTGQGILSSYSRDLTTWESGPPVVAQLPAWATQAVPGHRGHLWAPDVIQISNRYYLYYSVSTWGKRTSAIGLWTNPTLNPEDPAFAWKDHGLVVSTTEASDHNAIDPSVMRDHDGRLWMAYGSYWSGIKLLELDPTTGLRMTNAPLHSLAWSKSIEAAALHRHGDQYYLFVNWGQCCRGTNSTYEIRVGRSPRITGPYLDREGKDLMTGGGTLFLATEGRHIGPGHAAFLERDGREYVSYHYYDGGNAGRARLQVRRLGWDTNSWPVPGHLVETKRAAVD